MKKISLIIMIIINIVLGVFVFADNLKNNMNIVFEKNTSFYENVAIGSPNVLKIGKYYIMLYAAGGEDTKGRISLAFSRDGKKWIKYKNGLPVLKPSLEGRWDSHFLDTPSLLNDSTEFKLYYFGDNDNNSINGSIGLATSKNLITWNMKENPVISPGNENDWDGLFVESPSVIKDGEIYYMLYSGINKNWQVKIGLAISKDGVIWKKYENNPIIDIGEINSLDGYGVGVPSLIKTNRGYEVFYNGVSNKDIHSDGVLSNAQVLHATSKDMIHWKKTNKVIIDNIFLNDKREPRGPWAVDVLYENNQYKMWYETGFGFGYYTFDIKTE